MPDDPSETEKQAPSPAPQPQARQMSQEAIEAIEATNNLLEVSKTANAPLVLHQRCAALRDTIVQYILSREQ